MLFRRQVLTRHQAVSAVRRQVAFDNSIAHQHLIVRPQPRWTSPHLQRSYVSADTRTRTTQQIVRATGLLKQTSLVFVGALGVFLGCHLFLEHGFSLTLAYGISMLPTINSYGDWLVTNKGYRRGKNIVIGDVVSFRHPVKREESAVKRVIGMPGDFVLEHTPGARNTRMIQVPEGHCWVIGDNLEHSRDSRIYGPLPLALIIGKITWRVESGWIPRFHRVKNGLSVPE